MQKGVGKIMGGQILEYEAKDILRRGKVEDLLVFLQEIGTIPEEVKRRIMDEKDLNVLTEWVKLAAKSETIEEFVSKM